MYSEELKKSEVEHNISPESKTKQVLLLIMNSISRDLTFTVESQEDFSNGYLPTLDTQLKLTQKGITYKFYEKESNTPFVIIETSAVSQQTTIQSLSQEVVRRLQRTDPKKTQDEKDEILNKFSEKMLACKSCGYLNMLPNFKSDAYYLINSKF